MKRLYAVAAGVLLLLCLVGWTQRAGVRWEYTAHPVSDSTSEQTMNEYGAQGWEMVGEFGGRVWFKRLK